jgi:Protein kinase domain/Sulfatase-modifying factor enzyme 1
VAYAHSRGVVHRDLKPDNVMVGRYGQVYVMDWGLARVASKRDGGDEGDGDAQRSHPAPDLATDQPFLTHDGDVVGTPAYMPPEQAFGLVEEQGPRCDVYALGAILHHVLCGSPPYADRPEGVLVALRHGAPTPLLAIDARLPRELVAIAELAMRRDPARRYPDVAALTMDLRAYLEGRVVGAFESGTLAQARKWVLRHRALTGLALTVLIVAAIAFASRLAQARVETLAERFMVLEELDDLERDAQDLWPVAPERRADFERYIASGARLAGLLPELRAEVGAAREEADAASASPDRRTRGWIEGKLRQTLTRLEHFAEDEAGTLAHVRDRLARAVAIERVQEVHQLGSNSLLPLGLDPHSGLALFEHLATASPARLEALLTAGPDEFPARAPGQGIVFVELPDGLLFGRDEITLSQWSRLSDDMRSGDTPVTDITWIDALQALERSELALPDRQQWKDAVAGGVEGSFGIDLPPNATSELVQELLLEHEVLSRADVDIDAPAEVGSRRPNRYGLFDTIGNVGEFLLDPFYSSELPRERWPLERGLTRSVTTGFFKMRPEIESDRELLLTDAETSESASYPYIGVRAIVAR